MCETMIKVTSSPKWLVFEYSFEFRESKLARRVRKSDFLVLCVVCKFDSILRELFCYTTWRLYNGSTRGGTRHREMSKSIIFNTFVSWIWRKCWALFLSHYFRGTLLRQPSKHYPTTELVRSRAATREPE